MEQQKVILAMYSGGLDSLAMLFKLLTDPQYKDYLIHVHHIHNKTEENRWRAERVAVKKSLDELYHMGYRFEYTDSEIASRPYGKKFMYDCDTLNFFAGYIASVYPQVSKIAMGMQANDDSHSVGERRERADKILAAFTEVEKIYPVLNTSKKDLFESLPKPLRDKFWSCRTPVYAGKSAKPCGRCHTCIELHHQAIPHNSFLDGITDDDPFM